MHTTASRRFPGPTYTDDLKKLDVPTLILPGDAVRIVPIGTSAMMSAKLVKNATLKVYPGGASECPQVQG